MTSARFFFTDAEKKRIVDAIKAAEKVTSGEIRVHLENTFKGDIFDKAVFVFEKLKMHKTKDRNSVLIYLAVKNKQFAIIGDVGINSKVGQSFWEDVKEIMYNHFKEGRFADGLCMAIDRVGEKLKTNFPCQADDVNELNDDISFED